MDIQEANKVQVEGSKKVKSKKQKQRKAPISQLTREELEARCMQVEAHNKQLQNILAKSQGLAGETGKKQYKRRPFDFSKHSKRHVLLKFAYLGWDYHGFAVQEDTANTIETQLFSAFHKTCLIESRETSNYHRCGRTDKGVSAFDQVISITLRSKLKSGIGVINKEDIEAEEPEDSGDGDKCEIDFVSLLNKVLPPEIRMLAWCPVAKGYSARFDCSHRAYKYFFPRGSLNIKLMNEAAQHLVGCHDYRNLCKMDVGNGVVHFHRRITAIDICEVKDARSVGSLVIEKLKKQSMGETEDVNQVIEANRTKCDEHKMKSSQSNNECYQDDAGYDMCVTTIRGQAFLWHQVRAIMAVLFMVGECKEEPTIVQELLNVEKNPRKPQYCLASDLPLNLYETTFEGVMWRWDEETLRSLISHFQGLWTQHSIRATMIRHMIWDLQGKYKNAYVENESNMDESRGDSQQSSVGEKNKHFSLPQDQSEVLVPGARFKVYRPLLLRPTCESLETRVQHYVKRQRLDPDILQKVTSDNSEESPEVCNAEV